MSKSSSAPPAELDAIAIANDSVPACRKIGNEVAADGYLGFEMA